MANKPRVKMPVAERAKQFLPFAAVKGLNEALAQKERELSLVDKFEFSEEEAQELSGKMQQVQRGMAVKVTYYKDGLYETVEGKVSKIDATHRVLVIEQTKIPLDDICNISGDGIMAVD